MIYIILKRQTNNLVRLIFKKTYFKFSKVSIISILLFLVYPVKATDLSVLQILQLSSYANLTSDLLPGSQTDAEGNTKEVYVANFQPVYLAGFYFLDARLQNMGPDRWMIRGLFKGKGVFITKKYAPDLRYAYVENKKPVGKHWFFTAGRMNPMNLLPVQRLDGANIGYTPDENKGWLFGLIGGMVPLETAGYRGYYYAPYRAGAYTEYSNKSSDHFKVQYNAGLGGTDVFHQGQIETTKKYSLFNRDSFIRGGIMFTVPYMTFDYALAENSFHASSKTIHTIGYLKSETLFLWLNQPVKENFQQAFYRFGFTSADDAWMLNFRGGYTYSLEKHGYLFQAQIMRRKIFESKNGLAGLDLTVQQKGFYNQYSGRLNFGLFPIWVLNLNVYAGYEFFRYRGIPNDGLLYGLTVQGETVGNFSMELNVDFRTVIDMNTEITGSFMLVHMLNTHIGKKEDSSINPDADMPSEKDDENTNKEDEQSKDSPKEKG